MFGKTSVQAKFLLAASVDHGLVALASNTSGSAETRAGSTGVKSRKAGPGSGRMIATKGREVCTE
jgi:hypothetical protein